jgi:hypothetical protein
MKMRIEEYVSQLMSDPEINVFEDEPPRSWAPDVLLTQNGLDCWVTKTKTFYPSTIYIYPDQNNDLVVSMQGFTVD